LGREYVVLLLATLVWGSVHPTVKFALTELTSVQLALLRPMCACLILVALALVTGRSERVVGALRAAPGTLVALGLLGFALSGGLTALALGYLPAGVTSLITNSSPLMVVFGGLVLARQHVGQLPIIGTATGFGGLALLTFSDFQLSGDARATLTGTILALGSAAAWAVYTALARRLGGADPLATTAVTSAFGTLAVAAIAVPSQDWTRLAQVSVPVLAATVWSGAIATGCTYAAWSFALRRLPAVAVAPFGYIIPVSAVAISHVWLGEPLTGSVLIGGALVLAGVALTQLSQLRLLVRGVRDARVLTAAPASPDSPT
jgi:drug/metabolite transporter (DMT)-like permease